MIMNSQVVVLVSALALLRLAHGWLCRGRCFLVTIVSQLFSGKVSGQQRRILQHEMRIILRMFRRVATGEITVRWSLRCNSDADGLLPMLQTQVPTPTAQGTRLRLLRGTTRTIGTSTHMRTYTHTHTHAPRTDARCTLILMVTVTLSRSSRTAFVSLYIAPNCSLSCVLSALFFSF